MVDSTRSLEFLTSVRQKRHEETNGAFDEMDANDVPTDGVSRASVIQGYDNAAYISDGAEFYELQELDSEDESWDELYDYDEAQLRSEEEEYSWIANNIPIRTHPRHVDTAATSSNSKTDQRSTKNVIEHHPPIQKVVGDTPDLTLPEASSGVAYRGANNTSAIPRSPRDFLDQGKPPKDPDKKHWIADNIPLPPGANVPDNKSNKPIGVQDVNLLESQPNIFHFDDDDKVYEPGPPQPNTAFGLIQFVGYGFRTPQYARVDIKTDTDIIVEMMQKIWKMRWPTLVLSVYGSVVPCKCLLSAARRIGAWITSPATTREQLSPKDPTIKLLNEFDDCPIIGMAVWRRVHNRESLVNDKAKGLFPAMYSRPMDKPAEFLYLDPRHSQFILLDGATKPSDTFSDRMEMENAISKSVSIPHVVILDECQFVFDVVDKALELNNHVLIFKGKNKSAEALDKLLRKQKDQKNTFGRRRLFKEKTISEARIKETLTQLLGARQIDRKVEIVQRCLEKIKLITVVSGCLAEQTEPLSEIILKLLIKAKTNTPEERAYNHPLSYVASTSVDEDEEEMVFQELVPWELGNTKHMMLHAILKDDVVCVRTMLNEGASIKSLTELQLVYLYNNIPDSSILRKLLSEMNDQASTTSLHDVGMVVKDLLGDKFYSRYLEKYYKDMNVEEMLIWMDMRYKFRQEMKSVEMALKQLDGLDIFIWSILLNRQEMAKLFWTRGKAHLAWALLAKYLLTAIQQNSRDAATSANIAKSAQEFQDMAMGIVHEMHTANPKRTQNILVQKTDELEGTSVIIIAVELENRKFISHIACQSLYQKIFHGHLRQINHMLKILVCIFLPILIPWLITFQEEKQYVPKVRKKQYQDENPENRKLPLGHRICREMLNVIHFYKSPVVVFSMHLISFLCFLTLYGYIILFQLRMHEVYAAEIIFHIWVATLICEEIRQFVMDSQEAAVKGMSLYYWSCVWNRVDILHTVLYTTAFTLRFIPDDRTHEAGRIIFCVNFVLLTMHIMNVYFLHKHLGPKLAMIRKMVWDLIYFLLILFIFVCGFGVAVEAILMKNVELNWKFFFIDLFKRPYFHIYGELFIEEVDYSAACSTNSTLPECSQMARSYVALYLVGIYMIFSNVLLLNLLIAMFSTTYQNIQNETDEYWHYHQFSMIREYSFKPPLPPPFIILCHIYYIFRYICQQTCHCNNKDRFAKFTKSFEQSYKMKLLAWEKRRVQHFLHKQQEEKDESLEARMESIAEQLSSLSELVKDVNTQVQKMAKMDRIHTSRNNSRSEET